MTGGYGALGSHGGGLVTPDPSLWGAWSSVPGWWVPTVGEAEPDLTPGHVTVRESERWGRFPVEVMEMRPRS